MGQVQDSGLFLNLQEPRLSDWQYATLGEDLMEADFDGDGWSLAEMADGRSDAECLGNTL